MLYGTVSTGYRAGGVADRLAPLGAQIYKPEYVTNYEAGIRTRWFDHRLSINATGFHMKYTDLQVTTLLQQPGVTPSPVTLNAAKASISGVEVEAAWKATSVDLFGVYISALRSEFDSFPNGSDGFLSVTGTANNALTAGGYPKLTLQNSDYSGNYLPNAPRFSARVSYQHEFSLGSGGKLAPIVNAYYQSSSFLDASNEPASERAAYANVDLSLRYDSASRKFFVEPYCYNLTDKRPIATESTGWGLMSHSYAPPRRYGIRVGFNLD